jgi:hypothetical protein
MMKGLVMRRERKRKPTEKGEEKCGKVEKRIVSVFTFV